MGLGVRVRKGYCNWLVERRGKRRFFGLIPGAWHIVECYKRPEAAYAHMAMLQDRILDGKS